MKIKQINKNNAIFTRLVDCSARGRKFEPTMWGHEYQSMQVQKLKAGMELASSRRVAFQRKKGTMGGEYNYFCII